MKKSKKQAERLRARIEDFNNIKATGGCAKKKQVNRSEFTRPGSLKK